jgi:hypothetical protein
MLYPLSYEGLPLPPTRGAGCTAGGAGSSCRDRSEGEPGAACCGQNCGYRASRNDTLSRTRIVFGSSSC